MMCYLHSPDVSLDDSTRSGEGTVSVVGLDFLSFWLKYAGVNFRIL